AAIRTATTRNDQTTISIPGWIAVAGTGPFVGAGRERNGGSPCQITSSVRSSPAIEVGVFAAIREPRRRTIQFTRRGRRNDAVSRETKMRPRSRCNAWFGRFWSWTLPVLDHEAGNSTELGRIVGNQGAALCQCNGGDQHVIAADEQSLRGQVRTNPTVPFGSGVIERQRGELLPEL